MRKELGKKGAIELSMNTIIIVVIGITILTLGLRWIYGIFGGLTEQSDKIKTLSEDQITALFGASDKAVNIPTSIVRAQQGKEYNLRIMMRNIEQSQHTFKYAVIAEEGNVPAASVRWYNKEIKLTSGQGFEDIITFNTKNYALGTYRFRVMLTCSDCTPIQEESAPVILEVVTK
ncbi:MAG TPA: hypothetical protein VJH37_00500 [Candidatus Nanoarchaeia archaeon]|nr:hypothetical protein [Candidatus Nanoarchaeia archaeon]